MTNRIIALLFAIFAVACTPGIPGDPHARMCMVGWDRYPDRAQLVLDAADAWHQATDGGIDPVFTFAVEPGDCSENAVLVLPMYGDDKYLQTLGVTDLGGGWIWLDMNTTDERARVTALHELGHYFTGPDHSVYAEDIMFVGYTKQQKNLTARDAARFWKVDQ